MNETAPRVVLPERPVEAREVRPAPARPLPLPQKLVQIGAEPSMPPEWACTPSGTLILRYAAMVRVLGPGGTDPASDLCRNYAACLDYAVMQGWRSFGCTACALSVGKLEDAPRGEVGEDEGGPDDDEEGDGDADAGDDEDEPGSPTPSVVGAPRSQRNP